MSNRPRFDSLGFDSKAMGIEFQRARTSKNITTLINQFNFELAPKQYFDATLSFRTNKIICLDFSRNKSTPGGCKVFAQVLSRNEHLTELNFSENDAQSEGIISLVNALKFNYTLRNLTLRDNAIDVDGIAAISHHLSRPECCIRFLDLYHNLSGNDGFTHLAEALKVNKTLTHLNLFWNKADDDGFAAIASALAVNSTLIYLNLGHNASGHSGFSHLAKALLQNTSLETLILNDNSGGVKGFRSFGTLLKYNTTLSALHLCRNLAGANGIKAFCEGFIYNNTLSHLTLSGNQGGMKGAIALAGIIRNNTGLCALDISFNSFGDTGVMHIAEALQYNNVLKLLHLGNNQAGDEGILLISSLMPLYSLESLDLRGTFVGKATSSSINTNFLNSVRLYRLLMDQVEDDTAEKLHYKLPFTTDKPDVSRTRLSPSHTAADAKEAGRHIPEFALTPSNLMIPKPRFSRQPSIVRDRAFITEQLYQEKCDLSSLAFKPSKALLASRIISAELKGNTICETLLLSNNSLTHEGCQLIIESLKYNQTLKCLDLDLNQVEFKDFGLGKVLASILPYNHTLCYMNLNRNHISEIVHTIKEFNHFPNFVLDIYSKDYHTKRMLQSIRRQEPFSPCGKLFKSEDFEKENDCFRPKAFNSTLFHSKYSILGLIH